MNKQTIQMHLQTIADVVSTLNISASDASKIVRISQTIQAVAQELNSDEPKEEAAIK